MGEVRDEIVRRLTSALAPQQLLVDDVSEQHFGHAGYREGGETHFDVVVVSQAFAGLSRLARQRKVYGAVGDLMKDRIHALSISASTPEENTKPR